MNSSDRRMAKVAEIRDKLTNNSLPDEIIAEIHKFCDEAESIEADMEVLNETISEYQKDE